MNYWKKSLNSKPISLDIENCIKIKDSTLIVDCVGHGSPNLESQIHNPFNNLLEN